LGAGFAGPFAGGAGMGIGIAIAAAFLL